MTPQVRSFCRLCNAMCGIVVHVDGERVMKVTGDPDHPFSEGYTCPKGRALPDVHHDPARLDEPLRRDAGGPVPVSWDAMLDELAARLTGIIDRHGPDAVAVYRATHWAFDTAGRAWSDRFFGALPTRQIYSALTLDAPNKTLVPDLVAGAPYLFATVDWERTNLLLVIGQNTVVSHGHAVARPNALVALRRIQERGGTLVVADPRLTETARLADLHLPLRPGSDPAFLAYLVRHVLRSRPDGEFLDQCADPASVERLREAVEPYDIERTASECGLELAALQRVAELVDAAGRFAIQTGTGISMGPAPNVGEWLSWALAAVSGSLDRPGGLLFNPGFLRPQERRLTSRPRHTGPGPGSRPELSSYYGEQAASALPDEIESGAIRALFVLGGNPITALPDAARTTRALSNLDLLAVCDIRHTETTDLAHYLLPVAGQLERGDLTSFIDLAFPLPYVQYGPPAVACPPGRRPMGQVFAALGDRMGLAGFTGATDRTEDETLAAATTRARRAWDEIRSAPSGLLAPDAPQPGWLMPDRLPRPLDLAPAEMLEQLRAHRLPRETLLLVNGRRLRQANSVLRDGHNSPTLVIHPDDATDQSITDGQRVTIRSRHGTTTAEVQISESIRPGAVWIPHGWTDPGVNALTSGTDGVDLLTGMPLFTNIPITLEPPPT